MTFAIGARAGGKVPSLIVGNITDLRGAVLARIAGIVGRVVAVDDGALSIRIIEARETSKTSKTSDFSGYSAWLPKKLYRRANSVRQLTLFTAMPVRANERTQVIHDRGLRHGASTVRPGLLWITGTNLVSHGYVSFEKYLEMLESVIGAYRGDHVEYFPHRAEPPLLLAKLRRLEGVELRVHDYLEPFEFVAEKRVVHPEFLAFFPSTLSLLAPKIMNPRTSLRLIRVSDQIELTSDYGEISRKLEDFILNASSRVLERWPA